MWSWSSLKGTLSFLLIILNTLACFIPVILLALCKWIVPFTPVRTFLNVALDRIASIWIAINNVNQRVFGQSIIHVSGDEKFSIKEWYMVTANHQSWVDILILQRLFNQRIPFIKFFLKKELIWVPFIGLVWWALDFPFMRRYSKAFIKKHPELKGKDIEATKVACEKFQYSPVSIMNFLEGTRFTSEKHQQQKNIFKHLLLPKAGGLSFALNAMDGKLRHLIDVTIVYPDGTPRFFDYLCGRVSNIKVHIRVMPIQDNLLGDYQNDPEFRSSFQQWVNNLWEEKDRQITLMLDIDTDD
ncbi:MAG: acyltransferase [Marinomonas colpomeniae]